MARKSNYLDGTSKSRSKTKNASSTLDNNINVEIYRRRCKMVALDFNYNKDILKSIEEATSVAQLERIMCSARQKL